MLKIRLPSTEPDPMCNRYDAECVYCGRNYEGPCQKYVDNYKVRDLATDACACCMLRCSSVISEDFACLETCDEPGEIQVTSLPEIGRSTRICIGKILNS